MAYKNGDKVIITGNNMLDHVFEINQECTYIQDYGSNVHELSGLYGVIEEYRTITKQSVSGNCFKAKNEEASI